MSSCAYQLQLVNSIRPSLDVPVTERVVHQMDTACLWLVCHSRGTVQIVSTYPASPEARPPSFLGKASRASPQHGWRSAYSLRETLSGCLPREWCLCWSGGRDAWHGCSEVIGLSDPSTG